MKLYFSLLLALWPVAARSAIISVDLPTPVRIEYFGGFGNIQPFDLDRDGQKDVEFFSDTFIGGFVTIGNNRTPSILFEDFGGAVVPVYAGELIGLAGQYALGGTLHNSRENLHGTEYIPGFILGECAAMSGCGGIMIYEDAYIGVEFARATGIHYGWLRWVGGQGHWGRVYGWAWETEPGVPIIAGAVPEPGGASLLSAAACLLALRRRR